MVDLSLGEKAGLAELVAELLDVRWNVLFVIER